MTTGTADARAASTADASDGEGASDEDGDSPLDPAEAAQAQGMIERLRSLSMGRTASSRTGSIAGGDVDLQSVHEDDEDEGSISDGSGDWDTRSDASGYSASSSNERMRALHEALSRPPSPSWRAASAAPASPGAPAVTGSSPKSRTPDLPRSPPPGRVGEVRDASVLAAAAHESTPTRSTTLRARRPTRETAATHLGYPLPPAGERRSIADFVVIADIGRGAYGLVKKVRLRGADGLPVGVSMTKAHKTATPLTRLAGRTTTASSTSSSRASLPTAGAGTRRSAPFPSRSTSWTSCAGCPTMRRPRRRPGRLSGSCRARLARQRRSSRRAWRRRLHPREARRWACRIPRCAP
jgi:hypothetical protein